MMKRTFLILALLLMLSSTAFASEMNQTKISLSAGHYTGAMGFIVERGFGLPAAYVATGTTWEYFIVAVGGRFYIPDQISRSSNEIQRSNVFIGPVVGAAFGDQVDYWGGFTGGYDFNWGQLDEYHLTLEGGIGVTPTNEYAPYIPVFNISLGYSF